MRPILATLSLLPLLAVAQGSGELSWTLADKYVNGAAMPLEAIKATGLEYGLCNTAKDGFLPVPPVEYLDVVAPANNVTVTLNHRGVWCFRVKTVTHYNGDSDWTPMVYKTVEFPPETITIFTGPQA